MAQTEKKPSGAQTAIEWVESLVFATALLILVFIFLFRAVTVSGTSMIPTLYGGDKIIVQGVGYQPCRGDVIVVDGYINYGEPIVKRIIGVGGDEVDINFETATVTVNGEALNEPYLGTPTQRRGDVEFPLTVPEGMVFVLGDNRQASLDSRYTDVGFIDSRDILGKVFFRVLPFSSIGAIR